MKIGPPHRNLVRRLTIYKMEFEWYCVLELVGADAHIRPGDDVVIVPYESLLLQY